jgi:hypothetical protein
LSCPACEEFDDEEDPPSPHPTNAKAIEQTRRGRPDGPNGCDIFHIPLKFKRLSLLFKELTSAEFWNLENCSNQRHN